MNLFIAIYYLISPKKDVFWKITTGLVREITFPLLCYYFNRETQSNSTKFL